MNRRFDAIAEGPQRRAAILRFLSQNAPESGARWLGQLLLDACLGDDRAKVTYRALIPAPGFLAQLGVEWLAEAFAFAETQAAKALRLWLLIPSVAAERDRASKVGLPVELESMTLGHRRSRARVATGQDIERLSADNDAIVIAHLLANPRCTEAIALRIATRRPQSSALLELLFDDVRFGARPKVMRAVVQNPYTPLSLCYGMLPLLGRGMIRKLSQENAVREELRDAAAVFVFGIEHDQYLDRAEQAQQESAEGL